MATAGVAGERPVERPYLGVESLGQRQVGGVVSRMAFKLDRNLYGAGIVGGQVKGHTERVDDRQRLNSVVGREATPHTSSGQGAGDLVLGQ